MTRGILAAAAYLPHWRLDRSTISAVAGAGGGTGTRSVASYDEDTTTMSVDAARRALEGAGRDLYERVDAIWMSTVAPAYADKTNASTVHAALRLPVEARAFDANGAVRSSVAALWSALHLPGTHLVTSSDIRSGLAGGTDEATFGDAAAAVVVGDDGRLGRPLVAEHLGGGGATEEFVDRWRAPGTGRSKVWEERFGETRYVPLSLVAWDAALKDTGVTAQEIDHVIVTGTHGRACAAAAKQLGVTDRLVDDLSTTIGNTGSAHPTLLLISALEAAQPNQLIALVVLADGADVLIFRTTDHVANHAIQPLFAQIGAGAPVDYGTYLRWRGVLPTEPPRRPEPSRPSSSAAARSTDWKYGFVGSADDTGDVHLPPRPGDASPVAMADAAGTVVTCTIDRLAYSPSPPIVFAVVDFDGGGRLPVELTDVDDLTAVRPGVRVELTFRRLFSADDIHNYFWKARLLADGST